MHLTEDFVYKGGILDIPSDINYWLVRADGGKYYDDFFLNDFVAIADNDVTLESICSFPQLNTEIGYTIEGFKALYQEHYPKWSNQQISHAASRTMKFVTEIKVNDIVIVPSHRSLNFIIGIVSGEPYQIIESDLSISENYKTCPYLKRRNVKWLKEVPRAAISDKMFWVLSTHQTILPLSAEAEYLDRLLAPIYIKDGYCYGTLRVNKKGDISSTEWLTLYKVIEKIKSDAPDVFVKSNVQSPGLITILSTAGNTSLIMALTLLLSGVILGEINISGIKVQGIVPYFFGKGKLERERMKLENEKLKIENDLKRIEVDKAQESTNIELNVGEVKEKEAETTAHELSKELQISAFNAGKTIVSEKKMDNVDFQNLDELE